jgi:hypothetical protein
MLPLEIINTIILSVNSITIISLSLIANKRCKTK